MSIKLKGLARTTGQIPVSQGDAVDVASDDLGRVLTRYQTRDLLTTAVASLTGGTKTALATALTGEYLDLYQIQYSNNSDAATTLTVTDESTTVLTIPVAASSNSIMTFDVPLLQSATGVAWYVDIPDISGTTISINAMFTREK